MDNRKPNETAAYQCAEKFKAGYLATTNFIQAANQYREFVAGRQQKAEATDGSPNPMLNITGEFAKKVQAKILETKPSVEFLADIEDKNLQSLDDFYEFQMGAINADEFNAQAVWNGVVDGIGITFEAFDQDTLGCKSKFRGFLKRMTTPFERTFWANPYCDDPQDQKYIGYWDIMSIEAVKDLCEDESKKELIVPEDYWDNQEAYTTKTDQMDFLTIKVYTRFFRKNGEVAFEVATKYCNLYNSAHYQNPEKNEQILIEMQKEYEKKVKDGTDEQIRSHIDLDMDAQKQVIYEKAKKVSSNGESKGKFWAYPVSVYRPDPRPGNILGYSMIPQLIPNQRVINYNLKLMSLIIQNHAMPKMMVKPGALRGQTYNTSPKNMIVDYTPISAGVPWGVTRLNPGDAVNSNLIEITNGLVNMTRQTVGSADLIGEAESGYEYQLQLGQQNLSLQQPLRRYWEYIKNMAKVDLLFFKFYLKEAWYHKVLSPSEYQLNENYRMASQDLVNSGQIPSIANQMLPQTRRAKAEKIDGSMFSEDFQINVIVQRGIASNEVTESEHFEKVFQYILAGNADADKINMMITNDPAFTQKTRSRLLASLKSLEISQLQLEKQKTEQAYSVIEQLTKKMEDMNTVITYLKKRDESRENALKDSLKQNEAVARIAQTSAANQMSESEVKSQNAKGISGGSFNK